MRYLHASYSPLDGAAGGILAAAVVAAGATTLFPLLGLGGPWLVPNLVGATVDQSWARLDGASWPATPLGLAIHLAVGLAVGVLIAWTASALPFWATATGMLVAAGFWAVAQGIWLPLINPALYRGVPAPLLGIGHVVFGLLVGSYLDLRGRTAIKEVHIWAASATATPTRSKPVSRRPRTTRPSYSSSRG